MTAITSILRPVFTAKARRAIAHAADAEGWQRQVLARLIECGRHTQWGRSFGYERTMSYEQYRERVPVTPYESLRPLVMRMIAGERDILWPGITRRFAQSSGTTDGKSKFIPVTDISLKANHYRGGADAVGHYLSLYPDSRLLDGRSFILGGSFANELHLPAGSKAKVGDLSANLIEAINPLVNLLRVPDKKTALMADWHEKLPALVRASVKADVTNISGVPSWFLTVLREVLAYTGADEIHQVWPRLEVFFHGGISFRPYREQYDAIINPAKMHYVETYNASEGFFAVQDTAESRAMALMVDAGMFFEFIPMWKPDATPVPIWELELGKIYALVLSGCNGLWRYPIGDTVKIESLNPVRITIAGRTKHYINAFGEEVMVHNTDAALERACRESNCAVANYTVAPVFSHDAEKGHHQWLIEFTRPPKSMEEFATKLDRALADENSDYQAKRAGNIFLSRLTIEEAVPGLFDRWLSATGKLGGQRKVPRLSNDRKIMDALMALNK